MISPETMRRIREMSTLEIVWSNANQPLPCRRWHKFERTPKQAKYVLEEFVEDGSFGHWSIISNLEVVFGGRVA
jgi:hypothetical protein